MVTTGAEGCQGGSAARGRKRRAARGSNPAPPAAQKLLHRFAYLSTMPTARGPVDSIALRTHSES